MSAIRAIAMLTFKEAIRSKILYLFLVFAVTMLCFSWIIKEVTVGDELKIVKDLGISSIHFFGVLITIFIGINLIFKEMEKRTIYLVLSKPVRRYQFLFGKFFGLAFTLLLVLGGLVAIFYLILALKGASSPRLLLSFYMIYLEWLLIAAIAIVFSSFSTPLLSTMMTLACFFAGHLSESLLMLRRNIASEFGHAFLSILFYVIPNLELFNIRSILVHNLPLTNAYIGEATLYWIFYISALLLLSVQIFRKKDFV
jgi:ABC-type transport system involved in multi-copper enzyme maturation permease subunit